MTDNTEALKQAQAQLESIVEMFEASQSARYDHTAEIDGQEFDDEDSVREYAQENALSVEVRCAEWHAPGDEYGDADEYRIVVCTGGPHVEIRGKLNEWREPESAEIYAQDWYTSLEALTIQDDEHREALDWFTSLFYFGDS